MSANNDLSLILNQLVDETYHPNEPGVAIIVTRQAETVFRRGYGMVNLELGVRIEPDMVFRVGSLTKQFTAVAILMLMEQGKLALDDPFTRYLLDYPVHGHNVTLEHLLTHTSGIPDHTEMPEWDSLERTDITVQEIVNFFKHQSLQFTPGTKIAYSNSGYILLGAIIEIVSGKTYEQFLEQEIFDLLGMWQSYYDSLQRIIPRRVSGYEKVADGFISAAYVSMTQPFAAGSLASTVDDLAIWDQALDTDQLVKQETLSKAFTPYMLDDGSSTGYGYGWCISTYENYQLIEHSGGIQGFQSFAIRLPKRQVYVAVLSNIENNILDMFVVKVLGLAIGKPYQEPSGIQLDSQLLTSYTGIYQVSASLQRIITLENHALFSQLTGGESAELVPISPTDFILKLNSFYQLNFNIGAEGKAVSVEQSYRSRNLGISMKV